MTPSGSVYFLGLTGGAVLQTIRDDGVAINVRGAGFVHTIANTVAKIDIAAEAVRVGLAVGGRASEVRSLTQHVVDASLLMRLSGRVERS
jgi:hypothetical protein